MDTHDCQCFDAGYQPPSNNPDGFVSYMEDSCMLIANQDATTREVLIETTLHISLVILRVGTIYREQMTLMFSDVQLAPA